VTIFFTGDTHFGDTRVLRFDHRPYPDLEAHDAGLIAAWNETVAPGDTVWPLGPSGARIREILDGLNGEKHLIVGNNDGPDTLGAPGWSSVRHYAEFAVEGRMVVLCHYAFRTWNGMSKGALNLHGHSHGKLKPMPKQYDVGVDPMGPAPVALPTILSSRLRGKH
jgi:calcineurin-like phosphoesterase family protein